MSRIPNDERRLVQLIERVERVIYYGAALFLLVTIGFIFYSAGTTLLETSEIGALQVSLEVLDKILLIFIFAEFARHDHDHSPRQ